MGNPGYPRPLKEVPKDIQEEWYRMTKKADDDKKAEDKKAEDKKADTKKVEEAERREEGKAPTTEPAPGAHPPYHPDAPTQAEHASKPDDKGGGEQAKPKRGEDEHGASQKSDPNPPTYKVPGDGRPTDTTPDPVTGAGRVWEGGDPGKAVRSRDADDPEYYRPKGGTPNPPEGGPDGDVHTDDDKVDDDDSPAADPHKPNIVDDEDD